MQYILAGTHKNLHTTKHEQHDRKKKLQHANNGLNHSYT